MYTVGVYISKFLKLYTETSKRESYIISVWKGLGYICKYKVHLGKVTLKQCISRTSNVLNIAGEDVINDLAEAANQSCTGYDDEYDGHTNSRSFKVIKWEATNNDHQSPGGRLGSSRICLFWLKELLLVYVGLILWSLPKQFFYFFRVLKLVNLLYSLCIEQDTEKQTNSPQNTDEQLCAFFRLWWKSIRKSKQSGIFRLKEAHLQNSAVIWFHARRMGRWTSVLSKMCQSRGILHFCRSEAVKSHTWIESAERLLLRSFTIQTDAHGDEPFSARVG